MSASLPPEQLALIVEHVKAEQQRLLEQQREAIVQQVLQRLEDVGIAQTAPSAGSSRLEERLHSLVLHSLDERGLQFPHVTLQSFPTQPAKKTGRRPRKTKGDLIVAREDGAVASVSTAAVTAERPQERPDDGAQGVEMTDNERLRGSPLQIRSDRRHRKIGRRPERRRRRKSAGVADAAEDLVDDSEPRGRFDHRTLAILERSRALLAQVNGKVGKSTGSESFVKRMRQRLQQAQDGADASAEQQTESMCVADGEKRHEAADSAEAGDTQPSVPTNCSDTTGSRLVQEEPVADPAKGDDMELLRPPEKAPENESEWENELARQILTIYATSVKAKAQQQQQQQQLKRRPESSRPATSTRLAGSTSLPSLPPSSTTAVGAPAVACKDNVRPSPTSKRNKVQYSWEPSHRLDDGRVAIRLPKIPRPIWFAGTGAVKAVWCALAQGFQSLQPISPHAMTVSPGKAAQRAVAVCDHRLCEEIRRLEAQQHYDQCITTIETLLISLVRARGVATLEAKLWKQLVVTCNAFASRCVDYKRFPAALQLIQHAERLLHNSVLVDDAMRLELLAYLYDTYAHYYYRRRKPHAGLQYMLKAHEIHTRQSSWSHLAKCRLHIANLLSFQGRHGEAMGYMASILEMIEENKLEDQSPSDEAAAGGGASAQKICLAAVCYNNLAVEQLHLREFEAASVSTGNAKRLAKLCLSYSNRWLAQFDATSDCVHLAIATLMEDTNAAANAIYRPDNT
ncbi:hypothetical protein P43SY_000975 [Pythium insidiosum]|uniref:Uncharacterized protein n=1 Tax=Pythium insidiosum TaxID=114742 RepID=A0AAD5LZE3_PYTIN|nr:hypothetical protein P43SY_000975 [Pythium insidiosum]